MGLVPQPLWLAQNALYRKTQFIISWAVWLISMYFLFAPILILRRHGGVAKKASYVETQKLVTTGLYSLVRHPQYLGWLLMYLALICFNPNLWCTVCGMAGIVIMSWITRLEDRHLVSKFGEAYRRYQQEVPALNLLIGGLRLLKRR